MSALDCLDTHLLGRKPSPPDSRDWPLRAFLAEDPITIALAAVVAAKGANPAVKAWAKLITARVLGNTPAPPVPPTPSSQRYWDDTEPTLDQGQTPHCVGFGGAQWGNTNPVDDKFVDADGDKIYYECKVADGEPRAEDGSDVRTLAKVLQQRGRLSNYAFAATVDEMLQWVLTNGPVIVGTDWTQDMFTPGQAGLVVPTGPVVGGHCYVAIGYDSSSGLIEFINSWGAGWGVNGRLLMRKTDFASLFASNGEALAAVELPA